MIKRGDIVKHRYYLDAEKLPEKVALKCKITAIRQGVIYYRPYYGLHDDGTEWLGSGSYFPKADIQKYLILK